MADETVHEAIGEFRAEIRILERDIGKLAAALSERSDRADAHQEEMRALILGIDLKFVRVDKDTDDKIARAVRKVHRSRIVNFVSPLISGIGGGLITLFATRWHS